MEIKINNKLLLRQAEKIAINGLSINQTKKGAGINLEEKNDGCSDELKSKLILKKE